MLISVSDLKLHTVCPQKFHFQFVLRRGKLSFEKALEIGKLVHTALENKLLGGDWKIATADAVIEMQTAAKMAGFPVEYVMEAIDDFGALMPVLETWAAPVGWEVVKVEQEMRLPIGVHELVGTPDAIVKWNGKFWHLQHKSLASSVPVHVFADLVSTDWHESVYQRMLERAGHTPFGGTILNVMRKLSRKAIEADPSKAIEFHYLPRTTEVVDKALSDILFKLEDIQAEIDGSRRIEKTRTSCAGMFRNRICQYKMVCDDLDKITNPQFVILEPRYGEGVE